MSLRQPVAISEDGPSDANAVPITTNLRLLGDGGPILAVDLDDVLSQTNLTICKWHNDNYGTPDEMNFSNFYYYYYWKNPFWGSPSVTHGKVREFYQTNWIEQVPPVPGAKEGVAALRQMGYRLVIVTARNKEVEHASWKWCIICTGQFANAQKAVLDGTYKDPPTKLSKAQICVDIGARLLIDDSHVVESSGTVTPPHVLLFGSYEWNKRLSRRSEERDDMMYARRMEVEGDNQEELRKANSNKIRVKRVQNWNEVIAH
ncbi:hypothetical protein F5141DRAFT_1077284, partial [Pisolithus sp. B1]